MESPRNAFARLAAALDTLVDQELAQIATRDYQGVLRTQQRTTPVVEQLAQIGAGAADPEAQERVRRLMAKRQRSHELLADQISIAREALSRTDATRRRLSQIAPAYTYGSQAVVPRRLSAVG
jgi:hypothetical protein